MTAADMPGATTACASFDVVMWLPLLGVFSGQCSLSIHKTYKKFIKAQHVHAHAGVMKCTAVPVREEHIMLNTCGSGLVQGETVWGRASSSPRLHTFTARCTQECQWISCVWYCYSSLRWSNAFVAAGCTVGYGVYALFACEKSITLKEYSPNCH